MTRTCYTTMRSPVGRLLLVGDGETVSQIHMEDPSEAPRVESDWIHDRDSFVEVTRQLKEYFAGELVDFDLALNPSGTQFQKLVWSELLRIPFGVTASYSEVARNIGKPSASRAVGSAASRNPIGIVIPCHRVIGASGNLTGYAGGLDRKQKLLDHEMRVMRTKERVG